MREMVNKGIYEAINDLLEWYVIREKEDDKNYYDLKKQAIFYNLKEPVIKKKKLTRNEILNITTITAIICLVIIIIIAITR